MTLLTHRLRRCNSTSFETDTDVEALRNVRWLDDFRVQMRPSVSNAYH